MLHLRWGGFTLTVNGTQHQDGTQHPGQVKNLRKCVRQGHPGQVKNLRKCDRQGHPGQVKNLRKCVRQVHPGQVKNLENIFGRSFRVDFLLTGGRPGRIFLSTGPLQARRHRRRRRRRRNRRHRCRRRRRRIR